MRLRRLISRIASIAITALLTVTAAAMTQNQNQDQLSTAVESASRDNNRWFGISLAVATAAGIATAFVSLMVFRSGNRVQDAIRTESAIRIAEAHERARKLELEVSQQKERTANAERELLVLQERTSRRALTPKQQEAFRAAIADRPMDIGVTVVGDQEAIAFADDIVRVLKAAKWRVSIMNIGVIAPPVYGVVISTRPQYKLNPEPEVDLQHLFSGLRQASVVFVAAPKAGFQKKLPELLVGLRPITK